jgi:hypothetical protein
MSSPPPLSWAGMRRIYRLFKNRHSPADHLVLPVWWLSMSNCQLALVPCLDLPEWSLSICPVPLNWIFGNRPLLHFAKVGSHLGGVEWRGSGLVKSCIKDNVQEGGGKGRADPIIPIDLRGQALITRKQSCCRHKGGITMQPNLNVQIFFYQFESFAVFQTTSEETLAQFRHDQF